MKKTGLFMLIPLLFFLCGCEKEKTTEEKPSLKFAGTLYGGCNNGVLEKSTTVLENNDTIIVKVENDTLTLYAGINYVCCAEFEGSSETVNDTIQITVKDVCTEEDNCYCHCMCYYTFDFLFTGLKAGDYPCRVRLWDAMEKEFRELFSGTISISNGNL